MKVLVALGWLAISTLCAAEMSAAATTKTVDMRETIIPEWDDVVKGALKLTADTMATYWGKLEQEDLKRYSTSLPTKKERRRAQKSINDFYNSAATCLGRNFPTPIKRAAFSITMTRVSDCIKKDARMPKFTVAVTTSAPTTKPSMTPVAPATPGSTTTAPTAKPSNVTVTPTTKPGVTPAPVVEDTNDDDILDEDDDTDDNHFNAGGGRVDNDNADDDDSTAYGTTTTSANEPTSRPDFVPSYAPTPVPASEDPVYDTKTWSYEPMAVPETKSQYYDPMIISSSPSPDFAPVAEYPGGNTTPNGDTLSPDGFIAAPPSADPTFPSYPAADSDVSSANSPLDKPTGFIPSVADELTPAPGPRSISDFPSSEVPSSPQKSPPESGLGEPSPDPNKDSASDSALSLPGGDVASSMPMEVENQPAAVTYVSSSTTSAPQQQQNLVSPTRDTIPALSVLDADNSGGMSTVEWLAWVRRLKSAADKIVAKTKDSVAKNFLDMLVENHYYNLQKCILKNVNANPKQDFAYLVELIEAGCFIKLRYTLLAAPPPFELIARKARAVPALQIQQWYANNVAMARAEMTGTKMTEMSPRFVNQYVKAERCIASGLQDAVRQLDSG